MLIIKEYKIFITFCVVSMLALACQKIENVPLEDRTEDIVYDEKDLNGIVANQALANLYTFLPTGFNRIDGSYLDAATDDGITSQYSSKIQLLSKGLQSTSQLVDDSFGDSYAGIFRANLFLSKIDAVPVNAATKIFWKAEARFIRSMCYFELIKRYGGVPLLGDKVLSLNDDLRIPRNSYDEIVKYIVSECDAVSGQLLKEPVTAVQLGRITQGAALALKSRVLLYSASRLNNRKTSATQKSHPLCATPSAAPG